MNPFKDYISQNWPLILVLLAFVISLVTTVFLDKKTRIRMYILIAAVFLLSIVVFVEFGITKGNPDLRDLRIALMTVRYSTTPFILALITFALVKRMRWFIFLPALAQTILNIISIWTGIVFSLDKDGNRVLFPVLGYLPYIICAPLLPLRVSRTVPPPSLFYDAIVFEILIQYARDHPVIPFSRLVGAFAV